MTHKELDELLLKSFDLPSITSYGKPTTGELTLNQTTGLLWNKLKPPPRVKKKSYRHSVAWIEQEARWSLKRLELQGFIEEIEPERWRKLDLLEQLARTVTTKRNRKS